MAGCTNDAPCGKPMLRWVHSSVCQKLTEQGKRAGPASGKVKGMKGEPRGSIPSPPTLPPVLGIILGDGLVGCSCGDITYDHERAASKRWLVLDGVEHRYSLPCRPAPERAGREGDQALPTPGTGSVFAEIRRRLDEREATGVRRYGRSLETFNGRDACRDLEDELLDGIAYATQIRLEHRAVVEALLVLAQVVSDSAPMAQEDGVRAALALAAKLATK